MSQDVATVFGPTITDIPGWLRLATIDGVPVACTSFEYSTTPSPKTISFAASPPVGNNQKVLHARGTRELSWSIGGELSVGGAALINYIRGDYRGRQFAIQVQQATNCDLLSPCIMESISFSGAANGLVTFQMSGKCGNEAVIGGTLVQGLPLLSVPGWSTGNPLVDSWSISHSVPLTPVWRNDQNTFPYYYRPSESEISFEVKTVGSQIAYDNIALGIGTAFLVNGFITSRGKSMSGRTGPNIFSAKLINVSPIDNSLSSGATVLVGGAPQAWA